LCAEIGAWERFDNPDQLAAYLGIVPCEHTSGAQRHLGSITKAGSTHARRLLVEAAHHYRRGAAVGEALERRQRGQAPEIINISWSNAAESKSQPRPGLMSWSICCHSFSGREQLGTWQAIQKGRRLGWFGQFG
jgi:hypothetical protein